MGILKSSEYQYDVAISLCKEDVEFARKLTNSINPSLKVFFYEHRQEELICKSGPEEFARIFKEKSRVVVILSRKEWSESFYTDIERNAIIDRTAVKNEGYQFLMVLPMVQGEIPPWYPSTKIYASPFRFPIEELARYIEFKVSDQGGEVKTLTLEDVYQNFLNRIDKKRTNVLLQSDQDAIQCANDELMKLKDCFNQKLELLNERIIVKRRCLAFGEYTDYASYGFGDFLLTCEILLPDRMMHKIVSTQDYIVKFELFSMPGSIEHKVTLEKVERVFYYNNDLNGWAIRKLYEKVSDPEYLVLYHNRDNTQFYDLVDIMSTTTFVDLSFQNLISRATKNIVRHL